jgi:Zn finger protein HypA/HybF involved in hydrogenase expression
MGKEAALGSEGRYFVEVEEVDYQEAVDSYMGWCPACKEFTRGTTEPDATGYLCPKCGQNEVVGAEQALIEGLIMFTE